jgi:hypothetical protein
MGKPRKTNSKAPPVTEATGAGALDLTDVTEFPAMPGPSYKSEGHRLFAELKQTGSAIAAALGVSGPMVTYWRGGTKVPNPERRAQIERLWGIPAAAWDRVSEPPKAAPAPREWDPAVPIRVPSGMTLEQVDEMLRRLRPVMQDPQIPPSTLAQLTSTATQLLRLRASLVGDGRTDEEKLASSSAFQSTVAAIIGALRPYPQALQAVERALSQGAP